MLILLNPSVYLWDTLLVLKPTVISTAPLCPSDALSSPLCAVLYFYINLILFPCYAIVSFIKFSSSASISFLFCSVLFWSVLYCVRVCIYCCTCVCCIVFSCGLLQKKIIRVWRNQLCYFIILRRYDDIIILNNFICYNYYCIDDDYLCFYFISRFFKQWQCCWYTLPPAGWTFCLPIFLYIL